MKQSEILLLFEYNDWANNRILAAAEGVDFDQLAAPNSASHGSLRGTLVHALDAEWGWRMLLQHETSAPLLEEASFSDLAALATRWREEQAAWGDYLNALKDGDLEGFITYRTDEGEERARVLWHCLFHVVNHGTQHRSEAAAMLTDLGCSPGEIDFTVFMSERGGS